MPPPPQPFRILIYQKDTSTLEVLSKARLLQKELSLSPGPAISGPAYRGIRTRNFEDPVLLVNYLQALHDQGRRCALVIFHLSESIDASEWEALKRISSFNSVTESLLIYEAAGDWELEMDRWYSPHSLTRMKGPLEERDLVSLVYSLLHKWFLERLAELTHKDLNHSIRERTREIAIANQALRVEREKALRLSESKTRFLSTMSHEIRTPLNAVIGFASLLEDEIQDKTLREYAQTINKAGDHLKGIVNDVLDFAKIEAGEMTLETEEIYLDTLLEEARDFYRANLKKKNLECHIYCAPRVSKELKGDSRKLRQIILNLISNAIKFTHDGGILIRAMPAPKECLVYIDVMDSGPGVPPEQQNRLFRDFQQVDGSPTHQKSGGTGLGLSISKALAHLMGGNLTLVREDWQHGAHFRLSLPSGLFPHEVSEPPPEIKLAQPSAFLLNCLNACLIPWKPVDQNNGHLPLSAFMRLDTPPPLDSPFHGKGPNPDAHLEIASEYNIALVVEDNPTSQRVAQLLLSRIGIQSLVASNGEEAIKIFNEKKPSLIFMDLHLPGIDGVETTQKILKKAEQPHNLKVFALSASVTVNDKDRCKAIGMLDFIAKPVRLRDIQACLVKHQILIPGAAN